MQLKKVHLMTLSLLLIAGIWANYYLFQSALLGVVLLLAYLGFFGILAGELLFKKSSFIAKLIFGVLFYQTILLLTGSVVYILFNYSSPIPLLILSIVPLPLLYTLKNLSLRKFRFTYSRSAAYAALGFGIYLAGALFLLITLRNFSTLEAVRSPWDILDSSYLIYFFILTLFWLINLAKNTTAVFTVMSTLMHSFLMLSVGILLFPVGFGYDPFLHEAAQNIILNEGVLLPKTFYYLGHYALIILYHYLSFVPLGILNTLLVPISFAVFVPSIVFLIMKECLKLPLHSVALAPAILLLIPLTPFTVSTPQGLSFIYLIITLFWWLRLQKDRSAENLTMFIVLIFSTLFIHPLAGLPLVLWFGTLAVIEYITIKLTIKRKQLILMGTILIASLAIPVIFFLNNLLSNTLTTQLRIPSIAEFSFTHLWHIELGLYVPQFNTFFDLLYLYRYSWIILFLAVILSGIVLAKKNSFAGMRSLIVGFSITWFASIVITLFLSFSELITYEQNDFADRLFLTSLYFLLPFFVFTLLHFWNRIKNNAYSTGIALLLLALMITSVQFVSFPRFDAYERVRSFTTSIHDINAVRRVHELAEGKDYIVLANQSVSAAAIFELGFHKYYNGNFFYAIPTGGPLYQEYLSMVYNEPLKTYAENAAKLTGVSSVYFILNDYWFEAELIKKAAKLHADGFEDIDDGKISIFSYKF